VAKALGREAKRCSEIDAEAHSRGAAAGARMDTGNAVNHPRQWIAEARNSWIKSVQGSDSSAFEDRAAGEQISSSRAWR
jgi:hypothetical protein